MAENARDLVLLSDLRLSGPDARRLLEALENAGIRFEVEFEGASDGGSANWMPGGAGSARIRVGRDDLARARSVCDGIQVGYVTEEDDEGRELARESFDVDVALYKDAVRMLMDRGFHILPPETVDPAYADTSSPWETVPVVVPPGEAEAARRALDEWLTAREEEAIRPLARRAFLSLLYGFAAWVGATALAGLLFGVVGALCVGAGLAGAVFIVAMFRSATGVRE